MAKKQRIPAAIKNNVFARFDACAACGTWDAFECGHIVSEANGGEMVAENFVLLCDRCNGAQGTADVVFAAFAELSESRALITSRRAYWAKYCAAAKVGKAKPYAPK